MKTGIKTLLLWLIAFALVIALPLWAFLHFNIARTP